MEQRRGRDGASGTSWIAHPTGWTTAIAVAVLLAAFALVPQGVYGDDAVRVVMLRQLADGIEPDTKFSFVQPLLSVPLFVVLDAVGLGIRAVTTIPLVWVALWALVVWRLLARAVSATFAHHAVVASLVSLVGASVVGFSADLFCALGVSGGVVAATLSRRPVARAGGWAVLVVAAANAPAMLVAVGACALWLAVARRRVRYLLAPVAMLAVLTVESTWVTGELGWTRYSRDVEHGNVQLLPWGEVHGFGWPMWSGLLAILFSFGRGLVFFVPQMWHLPRRIPGPVVRTVGVSWAAVGALVLLYSTWWAWYGGVSFGPRFFVLAAIPAALGAAANVADPQRSVARSIVGIVATLASVWVVIAGTVFGITRTAFERCVAGGGFQHEALCFYTPEYSGLWAPIWAADPVGARDLVFSAAVLLVVAPTLWALAAPLGGPLRGSLRRAGAHLCGPWRA